MLMIRRNEHRTDKRITANSISTAAKFARLFAVHALQQSTAGAFEKAGDELQIGA